MSSCVLSLTRLRNYSEPCPSLVPPSSQATSRVMPVACLRHSPSLNDKFQPHSLTSRLHVSICCRHRELQKYVGKQVVDASSHHGKREAGPKILLAPMHCPNILPDREAAFRTEESLEEDKRWRWSCQLISQPQAHAKNTSFWPLHENNFGCKFSSSHLNSASESKPDLLGVLGVTKSRTMVYDGAKWLH